MTWRASKGRRDHSSGAYVRRAPNGEWYAYYAGGEPVRCDKLPDGSNYASRPWHENRDKPNVRRFPTARAAMRALH